MDNSKRSGICDFITNESIESYKELRNLQKFGNEKEININVEVAKDRKLSIAIKGIMTQIRCDQLSMQKEKRSESRQKGGDNEE